MARPVPLTSTPSTGTSPSAFAFIAPHPKPPVWPNTDMDAPVPGPCESVCSPVFVIASPSLILPICRKPVSPCNGASATVHHLSPTLLRRPARHHTSYQIIRLYYLSFRSFALQRVFTHCHSFTLSASASSSSLARTRSTVASSPLPRLLVRLEPFSLIRCYFSFSCPVKGFRFLVSTIH